MQYYSSLLCVIRLLSSSQYAFVTHTKQMNFPGYFKVDRAMQVAEYVKEGKHSEQN